VVQVKVTELIDHPGKLFGLR